MLVVGRGTTNIYIYLYIYQEMYLPCFPIRINHKPGVPHLMNRLTRPTVNSEKSISNIKDFKSK